MKVYKTKFLLEVGSFYSQYSTQAIGTLSKTLACLVPVAIPLYHAKHRIRPTPMYDSFDFLFSPYSIEPEFIQRCTVKENTQAVNTVQYILLMREMFKILK